MSRDRNLRPIANNNMLRQIAVSIKKRLKVYMLFTLDEKKPPCPYTKFSLEV